MMQVRSFKVAYNVGIVAERADWPHKSPYKEYDHIKTDYWYHIFDTQEMKPVEIYPEQE